jgi:hypothetical protein
MNTACKAPPVTPPIDHMRPRSLRPHVLGRCVLSSYIQGPSAAFPTSLSWIGHIIRCVFFALRLVSKFSLTVRCVRICDWLDFLISTYKWLNIRSNSQRYSSKKEFKCLDMRFQPQSRFLASSALHIVHFIFRSSLTWLAFQERKFGLFWAGILFAEFRTKLLVYFCGSSLQF